MWLCRVCAAPWPCGPARLSLLAEYGENRVGLSIYMATMLYEAAQDLFKLNPDRQQDPGELFRRFVEWPQRGLTGS